MQKRVLICGAGSIGIYLGLMLHTHNNYVELFGKRKLKEIKDHIKINNKQFKIPKKIFNLTKNNYYDFIFITVKLYNLEDILKIINKHNIKYKHLISIQNGLVDNSKYHSIIGNKKLLIISVFEGFRLNKNELTMTSTKLGWKTEYSKEGLEIAKLLSDSGITCHADKNFDILRAEKTINNCCLNALSAINKTTFAKLFSNPKTREIIDLLFDECYNILKRDFDLEDYKILKKRMYKTWSKMKHYSSTCQDVLSGRKTEIEFLNGYIIKLGKKYNLPVKENEKIIKEFKKIK